MIVGGPDAPGRLLVVDDNEMNRDMLSRRLEKQGYSVAVAEDGKRALAMLQQSPFDLVLLDIMMPEMDGYEVLGALKGDVELRHIPVVMISAIGETESVVKCIEMGADDYLPKPFNPTVLRARVSASLDKKKLRDRERLYAASLEREMEIGRQIQRGFLPESLPSFDGWDLGASFRPAKSVAGDFYDALLLKNGQLMITLADVCDKGVGAALYMALFRTLLRSIASEQPAAAAAADVLMRAVTVTNDYIATIHSSSNMFATAFVAAVDRETGVMSYINGGQDRPVIRDAAGAISRLNVTGPALGLFPDAPFRVEDAVLPSGSMLVAFTDGVSEAKGDGGLFGEDRLIDLIASSTDSASALLSKIEALVAEHVGIHEPSDDITIIALKRMSTTQESPAV